jgi:hypothetical protein
MGNASFRSRGSLLEPLTRMHQYERNRGEGRGQQWAAAVREGQGYGRESLESWSQAVFALGSHRGALNGQVVFRLYGRKLKLSPEPVGDHWGA